MIKMLILCQQKHDFQLRNAAIFFAFLLLTYLLVLNNQMKLLSYYAAKC